MSKKLNRRTCNIALAFVLLAAGMASGAPVVMASDYGVSTSNGIQVNNPPPPRHRPPAVTSVRG